MSGMHTAYSQPWTVGGHTFVDLVKDAAGSGKSLLNQ